MTDDEVAGPDWEARSEFWTNMSGRFGTASVVIIVLGAVVTIGAIPLTDTHEAVNTANIMPIDFPKAEAPQSQIPLIALYVSCASLAVSLTGMISTMILGWRADRRAVAAAEAAAAKRARSQSKRKPRAQ